VNRAGEPRPPSDPQSVFSAAVFQVALQVGCLTFVIIFAALVAGLLLDRVLQTRPLFTILLLVGSMPATWVAIFWIVNRAKPRLTPPLSGRPQAVEEEDDSGTD
jgi:F0F1-type ATP synthase assembly protein I